MNEGVSQHSGHSAPPCRIVGQEPCCRSLAAVAIGELIEQNKAEKSKTRQTAALHLSRKSPTASSLHANRLTLIVCVWVRAGRPRADTRFNTQAGTAGHELLTHSSQLALFNQKTGADCVYPFAVLDLAITL